VILVTVVIGIAAEEVVITFHVEVAVVVVLITLPLLLVQKLVIKNVTLGQLLPQKVTFPLLIIVGRSHHNKSSVAEMEVEMLEMVDLMVENGMNSHAVTLITPCHCNAMNESNWNFSVLQTLESILTSTKTFPLKQRVNKFPNTSQLSRTAS
jgi:hypothetical protein